MRNSRLVNIRYQSPDPAFTARAADALAQAYIAQGLSFRALASRDANQFLSDQLNEQRTRLDDSERALQTYKEKHGAVALTESHDPQAGAYSGSFRSPVPVEADH